MGEEVEDPVVELVPARECLDDCFDDRLPDDGTERRVRLGLKVAIALEVFSKAIVARERRPFLASRVPAGDSSRGSEPVKPVRSVRLGVSSLGVT